MKTYLRHRIENVVDVKELLAIEYLDFEGKYKNYEEKHAFWELCYAEQGDILLYLDGARYVIEQGHALLLAPDKPHAYASEQGNENKAFVVCFESFSQPLKSLAGTLFALNAEEVHCLQTIIRETERTFRMNEKELLEVVDKPNFGGQQAILLQLEYLLICLIRRLSVEEDSAIVFLRGEEFYAELVGVIESYLHEHVHDKLSLKDICDRVNYSRSFLCKTFKAQTGETLFECFNRLKMEEAKRLLSQTDLSVTKISVKLGFSELKYFGALFKKYTGLSPLAYKEKYYGKTNR